MTYRQYLFTFFTTLILLSGLIIGINRLVDPFAYFSYPSIEGFNEVKIKFAPHVREVKPVHLMRNQPASLIFGSSYDEIGFNPLHPALTTPGSSYNFGMAGSDWHRIYCNLKFALLYDSNLKQIVFGFSPTGMPNLDCSEDIKKMKSPDLLGFMFSYEALEASIKTVFNQKGQRPSHTPEGMYFYARGAPNNISRFRGMYDRLHQRGNGVIKQFPPIHDFNKEFDLSGIKEIFQQAKKRGIIVKMIANPRHAFSIELDYQHNLRSRRWHHLMQLTKLAEAIAPDNIEVWNFDGYNKVCTEKVSKAAGYYWQDPEHYNFEFGNIMLDEAFAIKEAYFGSKLSSENIDKLFSREQLQRKIYIEQHPEFLEQLKKIIQ